MEAQDRNQFLNDYTKLLIASWSDEAVADRLLLESKTVLAEFGLNVPADARVEIVRQIPPEHGEPDQDFQVRLWEQGIETGYYELHIPETPQIDMGELSEDELEGVAGGWSVSCCCCTPCCCCT